MSDIYVNMIKSLISIIKGWIQLDHTLSYDVARINSYLEAALASLDQAIPDKQSSVANLNLAVKWLAHTVKYRQLDSNEDKSKYDMQLLAGTTSLLAWNALSSAANYDGNPQALTKGRKILTEAVDLLSADQYLEAITACGKSLQYSTSSLAEPVFRSQLNVSLLRNKSSKRKARHTYSINMKGPNHTP